VRPSREIAHCDASIRPPGRQQEGAYPALRDIGAGCFNLSSISRWTPVVEVGFRAPHLDRCLAATSFDPPGATNTHRDNATYR
jgi:hypothetical protein